MSIRVMTQGGGTGGASASIFVTGLSETDTVTATKDGKTVNGKWVQKPNLAYVGLPEGYKQLEYIESTGTQYIDTDYTFATNKQRIVCDFEILELADTTAGTAAQFDYNTLFGAMNGEDFDITFWNYYSNSRYVALGRNSGVFNLNTVLPLSTRLKLDISADNGNATMSLVNLQDGTEVKKTATYTPVLTNLPLFLFTLNRNGSATWFIKRARISRFQMYDNDVLVRDFVPCINSNGEVGMYALVSNTSFGNAGTGTFIAGAEVFRGHIITIKEYGMWTVTATNGEKTKTQDVLVDAAIEFEIELSYSA